MLEADPSAVFPPGQVRGGGGRAACACRAARACRAHDLEPPARNAVQWGTVEVSGLRYGTATVTVPADQLTAPKPPAGKKAMIAGIGERRALLGCMGLCAGCCR